MAVINTNVKALFSQSALKGTERAQATAMQQLSTGKRINSAKDDAAGMAIATRMTQQIRSLNQAVRNAGDAISLIQTAEGATNSITDMMQRMRELAIQAINDTNNNEQRSYLDVEFQQLKQEISRISDMTEWNGFPILNGTSGQQMAAVPLQKTTSVSEFDAVFINPTTERSVSGTGGGEIQTITFGTPSSTGTITVGGVDVEITLAESDGDLTAAKVLAALQADVAFDSTSGRTVSVVSNVLTITYGASEGDVALTAVGIGATGLSAPVVTTRVAVPLTTEVFDTNGKFLKSGALTIDVTSGSTVSASFLTSDNETIQMTGTLSAANGTVSFAATGLNANVISDTLTYTFKDSAGTATALTSRTVSLAVAVEGGLPALRAGDLAINGITIGGSYPADDALSPVNNAAGSAIAKAAAINRKSEETGVVAKVNENIMTGEAMSASSVVTGQVFINGKASATITSVLNNTRESRSAVVAAINAISGETKVRAIDTGSDEKGITLVADDGRNIEVRFETGSNASIFGSRTGLKEGVQGGTFSLESKIETPIVLTSATNGDISRVGLTVGDFTANQSVVNTALRATVTAAVAQVDSVTIAGTILQNDTFTATINGTAFQVTAGATPTAQSVRDALVSLIAANTTLGVTATKGNAVGELLLTAGTGGTPFTLAISKSSASGTLTNLNVVENSATAVKPLKAGDLVINGVAIRATTNLDDKYSSTAASGSVTNASGIAVANAINAASAQTGVKAVANPVTIAGSVVDTSAQETGTYTLYINGVANTIDFTKNELATDRLASVAEAINLRTGQHGAKATSNGNGITLTTEDGRNLSAWFDSNDSGLTAASFGLEKGGTVAQVSRITMGAPASASTASVTINGVTITSTSATTADLLAAALQTAINTAITAGTVKNITVSTVNSVLTVTSTVPGSPFSLSAAATSIAATPMDIVAVTKNSVGSNDVIGVFNASTTSKEAKTLYGSVRLISISDQPFTVASGVNGYADGSNFEALGFREGSFAGRSGAEMSPPRVGRLAFQVGASANQLITIDLADFGKGGPITSAITGDVDDAVQKIRIDTAAGATAVLTELDKAMDLVNKTRADMGAVMNRLNYVMDNLTTTSVNTSASRSQIEDADYAAASTELAKTQIMQQAATAVLAQANTSKQTVLKLLQG